MIHPRNWVVRRFRVCDPGPDSKSNAANINHASRLSKQFLDFVIVFRLSAGMIALEYDPTSKVSAKLLQFRVLGFSFLQDWDIGVSILPKREEIQVGSARIS
jgi:hypothetical protein